MLLCAGVITEARAVELFTVAVCIRGDYRRLAGMDALPAEPAAKPPSRLSGEGMARSTTTSPAQDPGAGAAVIHVP